MVKVFIADVSELPDPLKNPELLQEIPEERKQRIVRFQQEKDRKQSLGAGLLLKKCLEEYGLDIKDIYYQGNGKPEIDGIHFNLSHSGDLVVCAISEQAVGDDIEKIAGFRKGVAKRIFTERELQHLDNMEESKRTEEFYRLWTIKESYLKMTGEGIRIALNRIESIFNEEITVYRDNEKTDCNIAEYDVPEYKLTICAKENVFVKDIEWITVYEKI